MKKKLSLSICVFTLALSLVACGSSNEPETYGGYEKEYFENVIVQDASAVVTFEKEMCDQYVEQFDGVEGYETAVGLVKDWSGIVNQVGEFQEIEECNVEKSGKTITTTLLTKFEKREVKFIYVYSSYKVSDGPTSMNVEIVYTMGEIMKKAGLNTVMGILIVFTMLVIMSILIWLFKFIPNITAAFSKEKKAAPVETKEPAAAVESTAGTDDLELVAVIAAAIAASTGASTDSFVVRSIRKRV